MPHYTTPLAGTTWALTGFLDELRLCRECASEKLASYGATVNNMPRHCDYMLVGSYPGRAKLERATISRCILIPQSHPVARLLFQQHDEAGCGHDMPFTQLPYTAGPTWRRNL